MKGRSVHLDHFGGRPAAALVVDGQLHDLLLEGPDDRPVPGAIYRAVADRPMKGQGGLTVRLPGGRGWLRGATDVAPGTKLLVQVTGYAEPGKAVPVTARLLFKSRHVIVTPGAPGINVSRKLKDTARRDELLSLAHDLVESASDPGLIIRFAAADADDDEIAEDIAATLELAGQIAGDEGNGPELLFEGPDPHMLAWREWQAPDAVYTEPGNFAIHGIDDRISLLASPHVELSTGGFLAIEPTRALVAVDVNTGGDTSLAAGLKANVAAIRALSAQLLCRGLGGKIIIDLAPQPKKDRRQLEQIVKSAFRNDPVETTLAGWTPLGCLELQRKRDRLPIALTGLDLES